MRHVVSALLLLAVIAPPAHASFSGNKPDNHPEDQPASTSISAPTARQQADRLYADAYDEVAKAKKDVAANKSKNAEKKFKKALGRGEQAVELDSTYHEAWNLVGYCARNLKQYDKSIAAYEHALRIKPDYVAAREYLGEAYVDLGQPDKALEQLAWLEKLEAQDEVTNLRGKIDAWVAAHPDPKTNGTTATAGTVDSLTLTPTTPSPR